MPDPKTPRSPRPQAPENRPAPAASPGRTSLTGQLLIAMPQMQDPRFARTVIYLCTHGSEGAMGLVV